MKYCMGRTIISLLSKMKIGTA